MESVKKLAKVIAANTILKSSDLAMIRAVPSTNPAVKGIGFTIADPMDLNGIVVGGGADAGGEDAGGEDGVEAKKEVTIAVSFFDRLQNDYIPQIMYDLFPINSLILVELLYDRVLYHSYSRVRLTENWRWRL